MAKGAVLKDESISFNFFVTMYAVNNYVTIVNDNQDEGTEYKDKGNMVDI